MTGTCRLPLVLSLAVGLLVAAVLPGQNFQPPKSHRPSPEKLKLIEARGRQLSRMVTALRRQGLADPWLAELEIFHKAAQWIVEHDEFYQLAAGDWTLEVLDRGILRAQFAARGEFPWAQARGHAVSRAYRSRIDGSVQPYAVLYPSDFGTIPSKKYRLDVELHGRDSSLTEVKFLKQYSEEMTAPADQEQVRLFIFGRVNNAYRWAGEIDVLEALEAFWNAEQLAGRAGQLDPARVVLRGFSMGGAGSWHLGLHRPDRWCAIAPGAGFSTTKGYVARLDLQPWQERCLHIYDAVDYAENAFNVPIVAYSGELDPQKKAADIIEERLKVLQLSGRMTHLIAPGLKHTLPPDWRKKVDAALAEHIKRGRPDHPPRVRFVTYTLRYPRCDWVEILGLDRHYERALVDAEKTDNGLKATTINVQSLRVGLAPGTADVVRVRIDGQELTARPWFDASGAGSIFLRKRDKKWSSLLPQRLATERNRFPRKVGGLQGPIDDAFMDSFLCVRGTGKPWNESIQKYAEAALERFRKEWSKYWRGDLPIKDDVDVTTQDIATKHLILFGDPGSNHLISEVLDGLPLTWEQNRIELGRASGKAADHVPVLIHPSPLNTNRYVVLNSGHTFHTPDYQGTNALLYPRLGDYALLRLTPGDDPLAVTVVTAGLFDDEWKLEKK